MTGIRLTCGHFSYAQSPNNYLKILGVTGTLIYLKEESTLLIE